MLQTAADSANFGTQFAELVAAQGSLPVTEPLANFLDKSAYGTDLRLAVKISRPALKADIAHFLNVTHGRHPGIVDHAATKIIEQEAREWLVQSIEAFVLERKFLNQLTVAACRYTGMSGKIELTRLSKDNRAALTCWRHPTAKAQLPGLPLPLSLIGSQPDLCWIELPFRWASKHRHAHCPISETACH